MYYRLKKKYRLRGWEKLPCAVVDRELGKAYFISPQELEALDLCNGRIDTDLTLIPDKIRKMLNVMQENGLIEQCEAGDSILPVQEYRKYPARYIRTAHWSVTGRCNYRCRHCYMSAPDAKFGELSHEQVMGIIDQLAECGIMHVTLTGGEPLLRSDFLEIIDALLEKEIIIDQIYSNGALVSEKLLKALDDRNIHPEFNMSYDGVGRHDWLRGIPGAEEAVNRAFCLCRDMGFPTGAEMCLHQGNKHLIRESILHLQSVGCGNLKTNPVANVGEWAKNGSGSSIEADELYDLYLDYIPKYYEDGMPLDLMLGGVFSAGPRRPEVFDVPLYHYTEDPSKHCVCNHARLFMYISPEGRTLPCMSLSGMDIQNDYPLITESGLSKCITDSSYMELIDTRADKVLAHNSECADCKWAAWCLGGCRAGALDASGQVDILAKDPYACALFRDGVIARLVKLMQDLNPDITGPVIRDQKLMALLNDSV